VRDDYGLVIFDDESTLTHTKSGARNRQTALDWQLYPDVLPRLSRLRESGAKIGIASNKGGVAYGYQTPGEVATQMLALAALVKADAVRWCCHHPDGTVRPWAGPCVCRKPKGGMLAEIMHELGIGPEDTLMVGDRPEDKGAALHAGCDFQLADDYFGRELPVEVVKG
jgi:D-glycero-D-manno-heptose 1,7-bisphosphate phosphatase